jgi:hypothetical protein
MQATRPSLFSIFTALSVIAAIVAIFGVSSSAQAAPKAYKNCVELNKTYKYGVSAKAKPKNIGSQQIFTPAVNLAVFNKNKKLDTDRDSIVCEVIRKVSAPAPSATSTDANNDITAGVTDRILRSYAASQQKADYKIEFITCAGISQARIADIADSYKVAMRFWSQFYVPTKSIKWVLMGETDRKCWLENVQKLEGPTGDFNVWNESTGIMGHCYISANAFCGYGTGVRPNGVFVQYNLVGSKYQGKLTPGVVHHEAVHLYQMSLQSENVSTSAAATLPPWFVEGQATLFGSNISSNGAIKSYRDIEMARLKAAIPKAGALSAVEWTQELNSLETRHDFIFKNELGYSLGWFILERVYQDYSFNQMHSLLLEINRGTDWPAALVKVLGITRQALYEKIGVYLAAEVN